MSDFIFYTPTSLRGRPPHNVSNLNIGPSQVGYTPLVVYICAL